MARAIIPTTTNPPSKIRTAGQKSSKVVRSQRWRKNIDPQISKNWLNSHATAYIGAAMRHSLVSR